MFANHWCCFNHTYVYIYIYTLFLVLTVTIDIEISRLCTLEKKEYTIKLVII